MKSVTENVVADILGQEHLHVIVKQVEEMFRATCHILRKALVKFTPISLRHNHHHRVARPWQDIAISTSLRHLEWSCARFHTELRPRLCCWRSRSIVRSHFFLL